jgi:acetyl esterase/lipase
MNKTQGEPSPPPYVLPAAGKTKVGRGIKREAKFAFNLVLLIGLTLPLWAQDYSRVVGPIAHVYATMDGVELKAYVFSPQSEKTSKPRAVIVLFHGGGWAEGEPAWAFSRAQHFATRGMVAIAAQYRLSDQKAITPFEAMADARAVIRRMRSQAVSLGVDPNRIAAYGWSAGAHLAASAAIFDDAQSTASIRAAPNALVLVSPAVSFGSDKWAQRLLGSRASIQAISPDEHIRKGLPPTILLQGREDTVTPLAGVQLFRDRMRAAGNQCDLYVYDGVGHLITPASMRDDGNPNPDPAIQAAAFAKADQFLKSLGFMK